MLGIERSLSPVLTEKEFALLLNITVESQFVPRRG
jgi:hypothetical protein